MALWQGKSNRKPSGGKLRQSRKKRRYEIGSDRIDTTIGEEKLLKVRTYGGNKKIRVLTTDKANVFNPKTKKTKVAKIKTVVENLANPHYVRRNIITKGAVVETDIGKAKITSRPGQDGVLNAVLV